MQDQLLDLLNQDRGHNDLTLLRAQAELDLPMPNQLIYLNVVQHMLL